MTLNIDKYCLTHNIFKVDKNLMLELVHDEDRKRLSLSNKAEQQIKDVFEDEPMKQARFKLFLNYLKRGSSYFLKFYFLIIIFFLQSTL